MLIDAYEDRWMDRLHVSSGVTARDVYLLLDGVFIPGLVRKFAAAAMPSPPSLLFESLPGCTSKTRDVSPFLIRYDPENSRLKHLLSTCSGFPMLSAIETVESQEELAARLAAWCVVEVDGQRFNFRFPDTRRLPSIFKALKPQQQAEMAGPATRWSYVDRNGRWSELPVPATASGIADRPSLGEQQFADLVSASEVDEVSVMLQSRGARGPGLHSQWHSILSMALQVANRRTVDMDTKLAWCEVCLDGELPNDVVDAAAQFAQWTAALNENAYSFNIEES